MSRLDVVCVFFWKAWSTQDRIGQPGRVDHAEGTCFITLTHEARAGGIAADLADGQPPELVRRFSVACS